MVYRIHFTSQDLARTTVAEAPMPLKELGFALRVLRDRSQRARLDGWRRRSTATPPSAGARMVLSLVPAVGYSPTYLGPATTGPPGEALDQVRATPRSEVRAQMAELASLQPVPSWARRLADDPVVYRRLSDGLGDLYDTLVGPYWTRITDVFTADRCVRMRQLLTGGVESLLSQANPRWMRWVPPVLEIRMPNGAEHDLYLEGRGVCLVPTVFADRTLVDNEAVPRPTVCYPASAEQPLRALTIFGAERAAPERTDALAALLGQTRASVLSVIAGHPGCSTKELAALAGIAPASASEHASVLRGAGLVQTVRHRNSVVHSATSLGIALLDAPHAQGPSSPGPPGKEGRAAGIGGSPLCAAFDQP